MGNFQGRRHYEFTCKVCCVKIQAIGLTDVPVFPKTRDIPVWEEEMDFLNSVYYFKYRSSFPICSNCKFESGWGAKMKVSTQRTQIN